MSSKNTNEEHVMHLKGANIETMINDNPDEVYSFLSKYQTG